VDGSGAYQIRFVPEDGRPPVVLARTSTAAGAQNRFAVLVAELRANGERGRVVLVNTERHGRFAGQPIREVVLTRSIAPWETRASDEPSDPPADAPPVVTARPARRTADVAAAPPRPSRPRWRFWER